MFWCAEELLFSDATDCYFEMWRDVESGAELKGPLNEEILNIFRVQALITPHALWLCNSPFMPLKLYFESSVACTFNKVSRTPVGMSMYGQNFTLTQNMKWYFYLCSSLPTQRSFYLLHYVESLLRVLHPVKRPIIMLDCLILEDSYLALAARLVPGISCWDCLSECW
jgi:hypothetical protein